MSIYDEYAKYMRAGGAVTQSPAARDAAAGVVNNSGSGSGSNSGGSGTRGQSPLQWGLDMLSRPVYASTNALLARLKGSVASGQKSVDTGNSPVLAALKEGGKLFLDTNPVTRGPLGPLTSHFSKDVGKSAWKGFTSNEVEDKKTSRDVLDYADTLRGKDPEDAPTFSTKDGIFTKDNAAAIARGGGALAMDIALDPLMYVPFAGLASGAAKVTKAVTGSSRAAKVAKAVVDPAGEAVGAAGRKISEVRAARAAKKSESAAPEQFSADPFDPAGAAPAAASSNPPGTLERNLATVESLPSAGALRVASRDAKSVVSNAKLADSGSTFARVTSEAAKTAPKTSEMISSSPHGVVEALLSTRKAAQALETAPKTAAKAVEKAAPKTAATTGPKSLSEFSRAFFEGADDMVSLGRIATRKGYPANELFPSAIVNGLSRGNFQSQIALLKQLQAGNAAAKQAGKGSPELERFLVGASNFLKEQRTAGAPTAEASARAAAEAPEEVVESAKSLQTSDFLNQVLKTSSGKLTPQGKKLKEALGPDLFKKLSSKAGGEKAAASRARMFDDLMRLADDADSVSPSTFDGMHESVRDFVEGRLGMTRNDFDMASRQRLHDIEVGGMRPPLRDPKEAVKLSPETKKIIKAATGADARVLANEARATAKHIAGEAFDPKRAKMVDGVLKFTTEDGKRYAVRHGVVGVHATATSIGEARATVDAAFTDASKVIQKTDARRAQMPNLIRKSEDVLEKEGIALGEDIDFFRASHIFDAGDDLRRSIRASNDKKTAELLIEGLNRRETRIMFNPGTAAPDTHFIEALVAANRGADDVELAKILTTTESKYNKIKVRRNPMVTGGQHLKEKYTGEALTRMAIEHIRSIQDFVKVRNAAAYRRYVGDSLKDASAVATKIEQEFAEEFAKGEGQGMAYLATVDDRMADLAGELGASTHAVGMAAEALQKQLPPWVVNQSKRVASSQVAFVNAARAGRTASEMKTMGAVDDLAKTPVEVSGAVDTGEGLTAAVEREAAEAGTTVEELYGVGTQSLTAEIMPDTMWEKFTSFFTDRFSINAGRTVSGIHLMQATREAVGLASKTIVYRSRDIAAWGRKYQGVHIISEATGESVGTAASIAWKLMQQGTTEVKVIADKFGKQAKLVQSALDDLRPVANYFFDIDNVGWHGDAFLRAGSRNIHYLERSMGTSGFSKAYGNVLDDALAKGELQNWWRGVDVDNPVEFLQKYNSAMHSALGERVAMQTLNKQLSDAGLISHTPKPGFAKPTLQGDSFFYAGLNEAEVYIDKAVLDSMSRVDKEIYALRSFGPNSPITTVFDPVQNAWKTAMTIMRPGHHVRNIISNGMLAYVAEGARNLLKSGRLAAEILARMSGDQGLGGVSELERLLSGAGTALKSGGDKVVHTSRLANGTEQKITMDMLADAFSRRGGLRTYEQSEDLVRGAGKLQRAADIATGKNVSWIGGAAGKVSEATDHHGYLQQFVQVVLNNASKVGTKEFRTLDDLYNYAIERSYQFHPDSAVTTAFEAKYLRRAAPFYNWFKGTLPAIVTSSIQHPGRVLVANKASFNIADMYGLDPNTLADPWSEDMDVPDFMREGAFGANAVFGDTVYALNPGFAHQDLARQFFGRGPELVENEDGEMVADGNFLTNTLSNASRALMSMATPFIKVPADLMSGTKLDAGTRIHQTGDYIDDSLPLINYLSTGTGISFSENVMHPLQAIKSFKETGRPIERWNVQEGYQDSIYDTGLGGENQVRKFLNFILGQGAQRVDMEDGGSSSSAPSAKKESSSKSTSKKSTSKKSSSGEDTAEGLGFAPPEEGWDDIPLPPELLSQSGKASQLQELISGETGKQFTPSQFKTAMKDLQRDELMRMSAVNTPSYRQNALAQLAQEHPDASINELIAMAKWMYPDVYE